MKIAWRAPLLCGLLLLPPAASGSTKTWTGGGGNLRWSNGANWGGGVAPQNGDDLVFGGQSTTNDLAALSLSSITVTSGAPAFSGNAASLGALNVSGGALTLTSAPFRFASSTALAGGTLKLQSATIGIADITGGTLEVTSDKGLSEASSLTLGPSAQFAADLYAPAQVQGTEYLVVHGNISLGGSTLVVHPGLMSGGQTHTLIHNDGPNPVSGTFNGLPEGKMFFQSQFAFRITYRGGSSGRDVVVTVLAGTGTNLRTSQSPASFGSPVTITASVASWLGSPTGFVDFFDGTTSLGSAPLSPAHEATLTTRALAPGAHVLTAVYGGDGPFGPNTSKPLTQEVQQPQGGVPTQTALSVSRNPATVDTAIALRATVQAAIGSAQGTVTFMDGPRLLGAANVGSDQVASLTVSNLTPGEHTFIALYLGGEGFSASTSAPIKQQIDQTEAPVPGRRRTASH